jgi:hypothetical protein
MLLEEATATVFPGFFGEGGGPACDLIDNDTASWEAVASLIPLSKPFLNPCGYKIRFRILRVALKSRLLAGPWGEAWSSYLHERAHSFGPDGSAGFSRALTRLLEIALDRAPTVVLLEKRWTAICQSGLPVGESPEFLREEPGQSGGILKRKP